MAMEEIKLAQSTNSSRRGKRSTQPGAKDGCSPSNCGLFFYMNARLPLTFVTLFAYPLLAIQMQD